MGAITEDTLPAKRAIRYMVVEMADAIIDPRQDQTPYIQSLVRRGVRYATAHRITKDAFAIAMEKWQQRDAAIKSTMVVSPATAMISTVSGGVDKGKKSGGYSIVHPDQDGNWSDYVGALPGTLPKPIKLWAPEYNRKEKKKISLKTVRPDLFGREFDKSLNGLAAITPGNALGRFNPNPIISKYPGVWDGIGYYDVSPDLLAECLPYLAEEGLLEFHNVPLSAVLELEEMRQMYIEKGLIQPYDRNIRPGRKKPS
ncbi:hypothetical protein DN052_01705 [Acidithiobacillus ferrooxidans]|uniref:Uncharacterized protein n=3 Tax=Acidithiobacillus ferrooxidans TaxID=920 RepID=A0A2W1KRI7_ACIFR|nr:hypothetical protein DN052_01705 [Acidithiobacillus ferrooxidans]